MERIREGLRRRLDDSGYDGSAVSVYGLTALAAAVTALVAILFAWATEWVTGLVGTLVIAHPVAFIAAAPAMMAIAAALVLFIEPDAGGSGIPHVLATLRRPDIESDVPSHLRLVLVKVSSTLLALLAGGVVGREGPTIQISAAIFDAWRTVFVRAGWPVVSRSGLLVAGGGAGLAAAFNTPIGGVVFAIEELAREHLREFRGVLILAVVTAGYVSQAVLGPYLFVGHPSIGAVDLTDALQGALLVAPVALLGAVFADGIYLISRQARSVAPTRRVQWAALVGLVVALAAVLLGPDAVGGGSHLIQRLLFHDLDHASLGLIAWRSLGALLTYSAGAAGGIFAPSLAAGAALGDLIAQLGRSDHPELVVVLGMIAFLTGATRSPLTAFTLVFEMTDRQAAVMPMLATAMLAQVVGRVVSRHSFYEKAASDAASDAEPDPSAPGEPDPAGASAPPERAGEPQGSPTAHRPSIRTSPPP